MEQKTPLYDRHMAAGGKLVPFSGWLLPVQYSGIIAEHMAVRTACGLFDVSHMGELILRGMDARFNLNRLLTNDFSGMTAGQARYSPMCNDHGGVVDDLIVYKLTDTEYFVVVNAANKDKDKDWIAGRLTGRCTMEDCSDQYAQLALQGPKAEGILGRLTCDIPQKYYTAIPRGTVSGISCMIARTGYTGEDGFELYCASKDAPALWDTLLDAGREDGLIPCGLGARDTLRLEAAMPLYGHELTDEINPYEAGLGIFVKPDKQEDFVGKTALALARPASRRRVGLEVTGRGIARECCPVFDGDRQIGFVTSGTHCPYLGKAVAMALIETGCQEPGTPVTVQVRGKPVDAVVVPLPFYKRSK
jgi:aminomethyltransferase